MQMYRLTSANINDGNDSCSLSFIFILTANPESIKSDNPAEEIKTKTELKKYPKRRPDAPINCKYPVSSLCLSRPNLTNSSFIFCEIKQLTP